MEAAIDDAEGSYDDFPMIDGVITESKGGPFAGYFVVKSASEEKKLLWEIDLIIIDERTEEADHQHKKSEGLDPWLNRKVRVFYEMAVMSDPDNN